MPSDYYGNTDSGSDTATMPEPSEDQSTEESTLPEEVVSKGFLMGMTPKVGDKFQVEITQVNEDSCLIKKVEGDEEGASDETSGPEEEGEMGSGMMGKRGGMMGGKSDYYA